MCFGVFVMNVFIHGSINPPWPSTTWVCLCTYRELLYLCVLFFIFLCAYLLHHVVYNTVVCFNAIIYFSMKEKKESTPRLRRSEVISEQMRRFSSGKKSEAHLKSGGIWSCDLSSTVMLVFWPLPPKYEATELWKRTHLSKSMSVCRRIERWPVTLSSLPSQNHAALLFLFWFVPTLCHAHFYMPHPL